MHTTHIQIGIVPRIFAVWQRRARANQAAFERLLESMTPEGALRQEIVAARMRAGLSQAQLARRMGTSQPTIARMESGGHLPSFSTLRRLAQATGARLVVKLEGPDGKDASSFPDSSQAADLSLPSHFR